MELEREVHQALEELFDGSPCWKQSVKSLYDVYNSDGKAGPSNDQDPLPPLARHLAIF